MIDYEYECEPCGRSFLARHSIREDPRIECPDCGGPARRLVGGGRGALVKGGTVSGAVSRRVEARDAADLAHANGVAERIRTELQPKTRAAIASAKLDRIAGD